jgi:hypothetical protein
MKILLLKMLQRRVGSNRKFKEICPQAWRAVFSRKNFSRKDFAQKRFCPKIEKISFGKPPVIAENGRSDKSLTPGKKTKHLLQGNAGSERRL